jgi:hypothetical protein
MIRYLVNKDNKPLKLYSIYYSPPQHPFGTVHKPKVDAEEGHDHSCPNRAL